MAENKIYMKDGTSATMGEDGKIRVSDGLFTERVVAWLDGNNLYVEEGLGRKQIATFSPDTGRLYSTLDEGLFTYGTLLGSVDSYGTIRNSNDETIGSITNWDPSRLEGSSIASREHKGFSFDKDRNSHQDFEIYGSGSLVFGEGFGGVVILALIGIAVFVAAFNTVWNSPSGVFQDGRSSLAGALGAVCSVLIGLYIYRDKHISAKYGEVVKRSAPYYLIPYAICFAAVIIGTVGEGGEITIGLIAMGIIALGLFYLALCLPMLLLQSLIVWVAKRNRS